MDLRELHNGDYVRNVKTGDIGLVIECYDAYSFYIEYVEVLVGNSIHGKQYRTSWNIVDIELVQVDTSEPIIIKAE